MFFSLFLSYPASSATEHAITCLEAMPCLRTVFAFRWGSEHCGWRGCLTVSVGQGKVGCSHNVRRTLSTRNITFVTFCLKSDSVINIKSALRLTATVFLLPSSVLCTLQQILFGSPSLEEWNRHARSTYGRENRCSVLAGKSEERRPLGWPRRRWEDIIKTDLQRVEGTGWIRMALVNAVINLRIP